MTVRRHAVGSALGVLALVLAACAGDDTGVPASTAASTAPVALESPVPPAAASTPPAATTGSLNTPATATAGASSVPEGAAGAPPRFLVFSRTAAFRHDAIGPAIAVIEQLGAARGFEVVATEDPAVFSPDGLAGVDAVVFLMTTGDVLDEDQQAALETYVEQGGGFAGVHSAADTEYDWPWYGELVGAWFRSHPAVQPGEVAVADADHPSTARLPARWTATDEWYDFRRNVRGVAHVLLTIDESTYTGGAMGGDHPIAWCRDVGLGRSWYTALGHTAEQWATAELQAHVLGGLRSVAGLVPADCAP